MKKNQKLIELYRDAPDKPSFVASYALQIDADPKEVYDMLIEAGVDVKTGKPRKPEPDWQKAKELHSAGATDKEIAEALDVRYQRVHAWRKRNGLPLNPGYKMKSEAPAADAPTSHVRGFEIGIEIADFDEVSRVRRVLREALAESLPALLNDDDPALVKEAATMMGALARLYHVGRVS